MFKKITTIFLGLCMLAIGAVFSTSCDTTKYYTVTFELNGGVVEGKDLTNGVSFAENSVITFAEYTPTKQDHRFDGWVSGNTVYSSSATYTVTGDVTFTAQWVDEIAEQLETSKETSKTTLESYVTLTDYRTAQQSEVTNAIAAGKQAIDNATTVSEVESALASAKTVIDAIKTDAQLTAEELAAALAQVKASATLELENYADLSKYEAAEQAEISLIVSAYKTTIAEANEVSLVEKALKEAKEAIDNVETAAAKEAKKPTITTSFEDGQVFTSTRATLDVIAKDYTGNKLSYSKVIVKVNGNEASVNWDDHIKTSYNFIFVEGANVIEITAVSGNYTTVKVYNVTCDLDKATTITVSIEAFSVGIGYIVAPVNFELNQENLSDMATEYGYNSAEEFEEVISMAHVLDYVLKINGFEMTYSGSLESTWNGFYMSSISGVDTSYIEVPEVLVEALELNGYSVDPYVYEDGTLCEFDVTWGSGWMYTVNGTFPNIPFCDFVPQDGDVMRVQFTLAYGSDIGDWGFMGEPFFEIVNRDDLTKLVAKANELGVNVDEAVEVLSTFGVTQDDLDIAYANLEGLLN